MDNQYLAGLGIQDLRNNRGGVLCYAVDGWAYNVEGAILHFYDRFNSVAVCGHFARPLEVYDSLEECEEFYHDESEHFHYARFCNKCKQLRIDYGEQNMGGAVWLQRLAF